MGLEVSEYQVYDPTIYTAPQAGYEFKQPWFEDYQRRLGASVFGAPGQYGGLIDQPQPIPLEGTAGLTPLEMMARQRAMGAGPYEPAYGTASQLMGEATAGYRGTTGAFDPYTMISPYYNPYETDVVQDTLERMRRTSAQEDISGRAQDISSGAFGGSRGRLLAGERQAESERGILGALAGIRGQGFQRAQEAAMNDYARRLEAVRMASAGLGGIAGQVLGMGGQRQGETMNWLNMMNQLGGQGRDIYQQGLSRMYQAALQKSQEPWERIMRGQALLQGMDPGRIYGGYTTEAVKPEISAAPVPTGIGKIIETGASLGDLWDMVSGWFGSEGGYVEKPKKYNEGGIVSGLVPIQMQDGGDPEVEEMDIPEWVLEALESGDIRTRMAAIEWLQMNQAGEISEGVGGFFKRKNQEFLDRMARITESGENPFLSGELEFAPGLAGITSLLRTGLPKQILSQIAPRITPKGAKVSTPQKPVVTPKGGVLKGPVGKPVSQGPTSRALRDPSARPVGPYTGGPQGVLEGAKLPPSITQKAADLVKGFGPKAKNILWGKPTQKISAEGIGGWERARRAGGKLGKLGRLGAVGGGIWLIADMMSGLNDEEKAEMLAKLEGLTEEQMVAVAEEQERLKKVKDKKDRSRALSRFIDLMYERPTTIGALGRLYEQERLGTVPAETVAAKEAEELARMSGLPVETVMMMQNPQGALFAREASAKHQQIANAIVNYLIEQGVLDEVTAVERRATLLELPEESLEKIARELGVPIEHLAASGAKILEAD